MRIIGEKGSSKSQVLPWFHPLENGSGILLYGAASHEVITIAANLIQSPDSLAQALEMYSHLLGQRMLEIMLVCLFIVAFRL